MVVNNEMYSSKYVYVYRKTKLLINTFSQNSFKNKTANRKLNLVITMTVYKFDMNESDHSSR